MSYYSPDDWNNANVPWIDQQYKQRIVPTLESANIDTDERIEAIHNTLESAEPEEESCQKLVQLLANASVPQVGK